MRRLLRRLALEAQQLVAYPRPGMVLITGAPRTGTSALCYWLNRDRRIVSFYESRILVAAHRMLDEVDRFRELSNRRDRTLKLLRQMVHSYYARERVLWGRLLVEKEPLEPIAFPDGRYREFLNHVEALFPEIKILFTTRSPEAVVWSMTRRKWGQSLREAELVDRTIEEACSIVRECNDVIAEYAGRPNVYVCSYERLTAEPEAESRRIYNFLGLPCRAPFEVRPAKQVGFGEQELQYIREAVGTTA